MTDVFKNSKSGILYFWVHFVTEVVCFTLVGRYTGGFTTIWMLTLSYDVLAFMPQAPLGYISDKFKKIPLGVIGLGLLACAVVLFETVPNPYISLVVMTLGNICTHVAGAEDSLRTSGGKLTPAALFVSGGSFGLISGKLLADTALSSYLLIILIAPAIPLAVISHLSREKTDKLNDNPCEHFNYANPKVAAGVVVLIAVIVVAVRGYMGYGIPTSWNKTVAQTVALYVIMGVGKALGGIVTDLWGMKKTALVSVAAALPFLLIGDNNMYLSLIGVMFFSMTMAITLGLLVSVLKRTPGLAFGLTTIGLTIGTVPTFFYKLEGFKANCIMLSSLTVLCLVCLFIIIRKDVKKNEH